MTPSGDWHLVLKVSWSGYIQTTNNGVWGEQSRNEPKAKGRVYIFDGLFASWKSIEDIGILYLKQHPLQKRQEITFSKPKISDLELFEQAKIDGYNSAIEEIIEHFPRFPR